jgi:glycosyltransferase involved in cell wall biosynthesis
VPRVVRIQSRICIGGPALHSILLTEGLSSKKGSRYDTTLIGGALEPGEASMEPFAKARGVDVHVIPEMGRSVRPGSDAIALARTVSMLRKLRPTIVHTHTAKAGAIGRVAARLARVPYVLHTFHGHVFDGYFSRAKTQAFIQTERMLARATDVVIAISEKQKWELAHKYGIARAEKIRVVPLGLELDRFRAIDRRARGALRKELGIPAAAPIVASVGRFVPIKRFDLLIQAMKRVFAIKPDAHLCLAGDGDPAMRAALEQHAAGDPRIHFLGWRRDLETIYADADVFALTSDNEGTPVAVIEALGSGVRAVATRVGGVEDILRPSDGTLIERGNVTAIADAILAELGRGFALPDSARDDIVRRFSHKRLIADTVALYDSLLSARRAADASRQSVAGMEEVTPC